MTHLLSFIDLFGVWIEIFLTFCILSYLYKDNPFYKFGEHLFVGVSIGYIVTQQWYNTLRPNLINRLDPDNANWWLYLIPLALVFMLFTKAASRKLSWIGRYPLAFVVALYAGIQVNAVAQSDLAEQIKVSSESVVVDKVDLRTATPERMATLPGFSPPVAVEVAAARDRGDVRSLDDLAKLGTLSAMQRQDLADARGSIQGLDAQASFGSGDKYWFGIFSRILLLMGLIASLIYFYFSVEQKGVIGKISRFGIWILMIGFGASFGYTVQGRLSLAVGRALSVLGEDRAPHQRAQIHGPIVAVISIVLIIAGLVWWERRQKNAPPRKPPPPDSPSAPHGGDEDLPAY